MDWSVKVKEIRNGLGLSQAQMARVLKVTPHAIQSWEQRKTKPLPFYQDLLFQISNNIDKFAVTAQKQKISTGDFLVGIALASGITYGVYSLLKIIFEPTSQQERPTNGKQ